MSSPRLVTIVASNDTPTDGSDTAALMQAFGDALPGSAVWMAAASEYDLGTLSSVAHLTGPDLAAGGYTLAELQTYVQGAASADAGVGNTIYLLYLPSGAYFSGEYAGSCFVYAALTG